MTKKYLSIGSVVMLKGAEKAVMIIGFCVKANSEEKVYDYLGCLYPEGCIAVDKNLFFNHDQIDKILYLGYTNMEDKEFKSMLLKRMDNA